MRRSSSRLVAADAAVKWAVVTVDVASGTITYSVSATDPVAPYLFAVKHLECHNDGITIEYPADEKKVGGVTQANDVITVRLRDADGNLLYAFTGSLSPTALDDYGKSMYLPDVATSATATAATTTAASPAAHARFTWQAWTPESFATAARERRILLVNVAASWCHWCHVMDHETYADPRVASLLRDHFMPIRVDADARPDLAERYAEWGWPATAVLTSDARPVLELRGFQDPEEFVAHLRELIAERDAGKLQGRRPAPVAAPQNTDLLALRRAAEAQLDAAYDDKLGGWGRKQKYPLAALDELSLLRARVFAAPEWQARAITTIAAELQLIDPGWGGMYQYSVGATWDDPHFEKIGAIQAGALESLARAHHRTGEARWRSAAHQQRGYILGPMQHPDGGFFTSQDADLQRDGQPPVPGPDYYAKDDAHRRALGIPRIDKLAGNLQWISTDGKVTVNEMDLYVTWTEGYLDQDGLP